MTTIAVMQPYFMPYAGYFRLFSATDLVVLYDCVQFPRRGYVHRNQLPLANGEGGWLTLPLAKAARGARIIDLEFAEKAEETLRVRARRFPVLRSLCEDGQNSWAARLFDLSRRPVDYISGLLEAAANEMGLPFNVARSGSLGLGDGLRGEDRVLAICEHFGATRYVNQPGGRNLYDARKFAARGIDLTFLPDYPGAKWSILYRLLSEDSRNLGREITAVI